MCGRYATTRTSLDLSALFEAVDEAGTLEPTWNAAPTDPVPLVRHTSDGRRVLRVARWGLVPAWSKEPRGGRRMINARAETVATTAAFARSFAVRRCLVPADGWYEWRVQNGRKQPYYLTPKDGGILAFAGLWATWGSGPDQLVTCSVVTMAAAGPLTAVHDRMPLFLPPERWGEWLTAAPAAELLRPPTARLLDGIELRPVDTAVGNVRNNGPELVKRVNATAPATLFDSFFPDLDV
jgi:putative SOS response-associated peptidase YedK